MSMSTSITLGNASYGFREYGLRQFFEASKKIGITEVEIDSGWLVGEAQNAICVDAGAEEIKRVRDLAAEIGVNIAVLGSGAAVALEGDVATDLSANIKKVIDLADALDARVIRVFTEHDFTHSQHYTLPAERVCDYLYETLAVAFNSIGEYAGQKSVRIAIENHGGTSATGKKLKKLLDMVTFDSVGVTYDPANFAYGGEDPYQALLAVKDRVFYTHWKDVARSDKKIEYCAFGEGNIDWPPIIRTLLDEFQGIWAIEYERKVDSTLETLMEGTRQSIDNLQSVIDRVKQD